MSASIHRISPLNDPRWTLFTDAHAQASIFHTSRWLEALRRTYGYVPVALTQCSPSGELQNALLFSRVRSWLTRDRMVSLSFSDHCQPLVDGEESLQSLLECAVFELKRERWNYFEIRPLTGPAPAAAPQDAYSSEEFYYHKLDLTPDLDTLFHTFHKSGVQRKIRRAEREDLRYEEGRSAVLINEFYKLLVQTRRRHRLPPQPIEWFQNLAECLGDRLTIRLVSKGSQPVASILTLVHNQTMVYKYGCSDPRFHNVGGMPLLFWESIQRAKQAGFRELDLGRTDLNNEGLAQFKDHLGAVRSTITYYRYPATAPAGPVRHWASEAFRYGLSLLPDWGLVQLGRLLYKHLG